MSTLPLAVRNNNMTMVQKLLILQLVIAMLFLVSCYAKHGDTPAILYVTPKPSIPCPGMPCLTLSQYSQDQEAYFSTDTELHFLSGVHRLNRPIIIEGGTNITKLVLVGERQGQMQSEIIVSTTTGLKLIGITSIRMESLHFSGINTFTVGNSSRLTMSDLQLTAMNGSAFTFENVDNITGTNVIIANSSNVYSAGVIRLSSGVFSNMTVKNNSGNSIMIIEESFTQFNGVSIFTNNSASKGSTLVIKTSTITFDGFTLFQSNKCKNKGGAMNITNSNVTFTGRTELINNTAKDGGAIQLDHSVLKMKDVIDISNNWVTKKAFGRQVFGGAISSIQSNITMISTVTFSRNYIHTQFLLGLGGAISAQRSTITLSGTIGFRHNYVRSLTSYGGAILLSNSTLVATNVMLIFTNNTAQNGGAIAITGLLHYLPSTIIVKGTSLFDENVAAFSGGALYGVDFMYIQFIGNTTLSRNRGKWPGTSEIAIGQASVAEIQFIGYTEIKHSFTTGTVVSFQGNVHALFNGTTKLINNTGFQGVLQVLDKNSSITFLGQSYFKGNRGGTIILKDSTPSNPSMIGGEAMFIDNDSGISLSYSEIKLEGDFNFTHNRSPRTGCITTIGSNVTINGTMLMNFNTAETGPAIYSYNSSFKMYGDCHIANHTVLGGGGAVFALRTSLHLNGNILFASNSASTEGGAISAVNSELFLSGRHVYMNNSANVGGVISIGLFSAIHFNDLEVTYEDNKAERGAIFYHDDVLNAVDCLDDPGLPAPIEPLSVRTRCFFSISDDVNVTLTNNIASDVGNILFGGNLERCNKRQTAETFIYLFHTDGSIQNITSSPYQTVFCKNDKPVIKGSKRTIKYDKIITTIPGKLFSVSLAGLNQLLKPISSTIRAEISAESNSTARLGPFQSNQLTNDSCAKLDYRVFTQAPSIYLTLYAEGPCNKLGTAAKTVKLKLEPCPDGFELVRDECICEADLLKYTLTCNVDDESIQNSGNFWAGGLYDDNASYIGIVSFPNCPFDYCTKETVSFTLMDPDIQCAHNRSGTICGQCMVNYSLTFGDVQCSDCSKINPAVTFGLLLLFALVGIILVVFLTLLKMTVASGTLNGLIFYANIVDANRDILVPQAGWVRVFISWLNLDFGFSICFYRGMDMYVYTWLQFLFPFYIWMLIGVLIVISRRSAWVTKRVGSNPVAVLATLILLSYAKLLRTVITVFYFATLQLPHGQTSTVWLYDGNVLYLRGKHLALFIFALLFFMVVFLPYNFLLVVGPWLQSISGERVNEPEPRAFIRKVLLGWYEDYRLRSFLDTYTVAYNPGYQYWTGVFLMLRCMLFIVFVTSAFRNSSATLMAVTTSLLVIIFLTRAFTGRIYKNWYVHILEGLFLLNLGILSVATSHNLMTGGNQQLVANISGGISLTLFLVIVAHHVIKQVTEADVYRVIVMKLKRRFRPVRDDNDQQAQLLSPPTDKQELAPMTTVITLPASK